MAVEKRNSSPLVPDGSPVMAAQHRNKLVSSLRRVRREGCELISSILGSMTPFTASIPNKTDLTCGDMLSYSSISTVL